MHALAPPHRRCGRDGPVVRRPRSGDGSHLGPETWPFTFIAPLGFVCPVTRAHVRLLGPCFKTGRVEGRPGRHRPCAPARPWPAGRHRRSGSTACSPPQSNRRRRPGGRAVGRERRCASVSQPTNASPAYKTPDRGRATLPAGLRRPRNRSWRSRRGKCARREAAGRGAVPMVPVLRGHRAPGGLNSPARLCGSTRLPLNGFTYY